MPKQPIASLTASLMTPPAPAVQEPPPPAPPLSQPASAPSVEASDGGREGKPAKPVAQTVKLEHRLFVRLKSFSADRRQSHQEIFVAALQEYLQRNGG